MPCDTGKGYEKLSMMMKSGRKPGDKKKPPMKGKKY